MSRPRPPQPAKLIVGMFTADKHLISPAARELEAAFGEFELISPWWPFDFTDYYRKEMGAPLFRRMLVFRSLVKQGALPEIKLQTNLFEDSFAVGGRRRLNLDPGFLLMERFVLATGKNYSHRVYLGKGIYADLTLVYRRGGYRALDWTYPDYADPKIRSFLGIVRKKYARDLRQGAQR